MIFIIIMLDKSLILLLRISWCDGESKLRSSW